MNAEAVQCASRNTLETARNDAHENIQISALEVELNQECAPKPVRVATALLEEATIKLHNGQIENFGTNMEDVIKRRVKSAFKEVGANELSAMVEDLLDNILRTSFYNAQSCIRSLLYNIVE